MNRGIHLSRADPQIQDLKDTAVRLVCFFFLYVCFTKCIHAFQETIIKTFLLPEDIALQKQLERRLHKVAISYFSYYSEMQRDQFSDFHGLRDFYALVKSIGRQKRLVSHNFGKFIHG